jgi:hypothetical protein
LTSTISRGSRVYQLSITDVWEQKTLYEVELPNSARISVVDPHAIAVLDPAGQFRVIDVQTGQPIIDQKLEDLPDVTAFHTMRGGDDLFVLISGQVQPQFKALGQPFDYPVVNGPVYAFNMKSGKELWPGPAIVRNRGIFLSQPPDVPFLVLADQQMTRDAAGGGAQLRVLCLDKRTGETVHRNDRLPFNANARFRVRAETETGPAVVLELGAAKIQLTMTDRPRPPQPPANDDVEASREMVERGLRALGVRLGGELRGALDKPASNAAPQKDKNGKIPAKNPNDDMDDD